MHRRSKTTHPSFIIRCLLTEATLSLFCWQNASSEAASGTPRRPCSSPEGSDRNVSHTAPRIKDRRALSNPLAPENTAAVGAALTTSQKRRNWPPSRARVASSTARTRASASCPEGSNEATARRSLDGKRIIERTRTDATWPASALSGKHEYSFRRYRFASKS
jgi:hypothetical protein